MKNQRSRSHPAACGIVTVTAFILSNCLCYLFLGVMAIAATPTTKYHLIKKIPLGGEGRWDYLTLDSAARRLYVTRETRVTVLDVDTGEVVGEVSHTVGVHGVAIAPELGRGFTSNGRDSTATIFDLKTLQVLGQVKTGNNPDAIVYDPFSRQVFTFNGKSADATVFDAATGKVVGSIQLGGTPEFAATNGRGRIYVNLEDKSELLAIDTSSLKVLANWPLAPCTSPTGMAIDRQHWRLFIGCGNRMMAVVDARRGHILATLPIGSGVDANAFDQEQGLAFSSNGEGTLTVVHEDSPNKFSVVDSVVTQRGARTMALDSKTHNVFLATAQFGATPAPTPKQPKPRPSIVPGTVVILVFGE